MNPEKRNQTGWYTEPEGAQCDGTGLESQLRGSDRLKSHTVEKALQNVRSNESHGLPHTKTVTTDMTTTEATDSTIRSPLPPLSLQPLQHSWQKVRKPLPPHRKLPLTGSSPEGSKFPPQTLKCYPLKTFWDPCFKILLRKVFFPPAPTPCPPPDSHIHMVVR